MIKTSIAILSLAFIVNLGFAQEVCMDHCIPEEAISAKNIHRIHWLGAEPPEEIIDVRWHKTEPLIFILTNWRLGFGNGVLGSDLEVWDWKYGVGHGYSRYSLVSGPFTQLEVLPDKVVTGTVSGSLLFWDIKQGEFIYDLYLGDGEVSELLLHPSDKWILAVIDGAKLFQFDIELQSATEFHLPGAEGLAIHDLAFSSDGQLLAIGGNEMFRLWETNSWAQWEPQRLSVESVNDLLFTKDDAHLIVVADTSLSRWSLANNHVTFVRELEHHPSKRLCQFVDGDISPDGTLLMTADSCSQLRAWDLTADAEIVIPGPDHSNDRNPGTSVVFSPDGLLLSDVSWNHWTFMLIPSPSPNVRYIFGDGSRS